MKPVQARGERTSWQQQQRQQLGCPKKLPVCARLLPLVSVNLSKGSEQVSGKREAIGRRQTNRVEGQGSGTCCTWRPLQRCAFCVLFFSKYYWQQRKKLPSSQAGADNGNSRGGRGGCCNNCLKCVSELNIPWSAVVHRRMRQLK